MTDPRRKYDPQFHLADWFYAWPAVCGVGAFSILTYLQTNDCAIIAALRPGVSSADFDILDGAWRVGGRKHRLGRELDSLADVISFGVASAIGTYGCGMPGPV
jgi:CDP-diacylglycerol--serine O-phosphatidyltransferase